MTIPRGTKITAILLIVISGLQIVGPLFIMAKMVSEPGISSGLIILISIFVSILPAIGLASGVGVMCLKPWALNCVLGFSKISIAFYGVGVLLHFLLDSSPRGSDVFFVIAYGCTLPLWSLYYFTQPYVKVLFAPK